MKLSRNWLQDFVDLEGISNEELCEVITTRIAEIDDSWQVGENISKAEIVTIENAEVHPERSGLRICQLSNGVQVVCGAPNARDGLRAVWLPPGATLKKDDAVFEISERDFAGVKSKGVLVSEVELEVGPEKGGIIELPESVSSLEKHFGGADLIIEIDNKSLTHRPDLWCHLGFAREVSGVFGRRLNADMAAPDLRVAEEKCKIEISDESDCRRFMGVVINGVEAKPSPVWMKRRLHSIGLGVKNVLVDLSNYVMLDVGQPNHLYDAEKINGNVLRSARGGELTALDGESYKLTEQDISIWDSKGAVGVGGVIGGEKSSVSENTKKVILEAANFDPVAIRKTSKRLGIRTDASNRFEKSLSPELPELGVKRFLQLLADQFSALTISEVVDAGSAKQNLPEIKVSTSWINERLGTSLEPKQIIKLLTSVGFEVSGETDLVVKVPGFRATGDVSIAEDILEEVGRLNGYENIEPESPRFEVRPIAETKLHKLETSVLHLLEGRGLNEVQLYSSVAEELQRKFGYTGETINLQNPVDSTAAQLRLSLVPGIAKCLEENARFQENYGVFELGRSYRKDGKDCRENRLLGIGAACDALSTSPQVKDGQGFYFVSKLVSDVAGLVSSEALEIRPKAEFSWQHPYRSGEILLGGIRLGVIGEIHPSLSSQRFILAEIDLETLLSKETSVLHQSSSKFPPSFFEVSVVAPENTYFTQLADVVSSGAHKSKLKSVSFVSEFSGGAVKDGHKSVSLQLEFSDESKTISKEELESFRESVVKSVEKSEFEFRA